MEKYIFSRWEAVEIFIKIIARFEQKSYEDVEINLFEYLSKFKSAKASAAVAEKTIRIIADDLGNENFYPNFLSELSEEISNGVPKVRSRHRIYLLLKYVGEISQIERYRFNNQDDVKSESLAGSCWWMYSHEYYIDKTTKQKIMYITCDMVWLNPFSYAKVLATKNHEGGKLGLQHYSGNYYTKNNRYLFLDLHISESREKDLRVVVDIGAGHSAIGEVFTGYYLNASNNLYFGPILFERIPKQDKLSARNFEENDYELDRTIWDYFSGLNSLPYKVIPSYGSTGKMSRFLDM